MGLFDCIIDTKLSEENEPYYIGYSYGYDYEHGIAGTDGWAIVLAQSAAEAHKMMAEKLEKAGVGNKGSIHTTIQIGRDQKWIFQWGMPLQKPTTE